MTEDRNRIILEEKQEKKRNWHRLRQSSSQRHTLNRIYSRGEKRKNLKMHPNVLAPPAGFGMQAAASGLAHRYSIYCMHRIQPQRQNCLSSALSSNQRERATVLYTLLKNNIYIAYISGTVIAITKIPTDLSSYKKNFKKLITTS